MEQSFETVDSLTQKGFKVYVRHNRKFMPSKYVCSIEGDNYYEEVLNPRGGSTEVVVVREEGIKFLEKMEPHIFRYTKINNGGNLLYGKAICCKGDNYNKKIGVKIAMARALFMGCIYTMDQAIEAIEIAEMLEIRPSKKKRKKRNLEIEVVEDRSINIPLGEPNVTEYAAIAAQHQKDIIPNPPLPNEPFALVCNLCVALGLKNLNEHIAAWEYQIGPWHIALNAHNLPTRSTRGTNIEPFQAAIEHDNKMAGWVAMNKHSIAAGNRDQTQDFCDAVKDEIYRVSKLRTEMDPETKQVVHEQGYF